MHFSLCWYRPTLGSISKGGLGTLFGSKVQCSGRNSVMALAKHAGQDVQLGQNDVSVVWSSDWMLVLLGFIHPSVFDV